MADDFDPDAFYQKYGIDIRLSGGPSNPVTPELPLSSAGLDAQAALLHQLSAMKATVEMMEIVVRDFPSNDAAFDGIDSALAERMRMVTEARARFRDRRECTGAA